MMLKSKGLTKPNNVRNSQEPILTTDWYILKLHFISSWKSTLCLKDPPCNKVIVEIIESYQSCLGRKPNFFCTDKQNCFNIFLYFVERKLLRNIYQQKILRITIGFPFTFYQPFSPECLIFYWVENFHLSWEFSLEWINFSWLENFFSRWEFSLWLRIFSQVDNFLSSWEFSPELRIFSKVENFPKGWKFSL